jgi:hypothetical protein
MNAAHTPGPWACQHGADDYFEVVKAGGASLSYSAKITKANARLIAASPDLLEALERLVERVTDLGANGFSQEVANGKAAIAKAKGGQGE